MPTYISPNPPNIAYNGNQTTWWIPAINLSPVLTATNVKVNISLNAPGLKIITWDGPGTFNINSGIWQVGSLSPNETKKLKIVTEVIDIGLAPFTITSVISGDGIDPNNVNNTTTQTITLVPGTLTVGANDDENKCPCINVGSNDVACNFGETEWRLKTTTLTNTDNYTWDVNTGKGHFIHVDPSLPITGQYEVWCDPGTGFVKVGGPNDFSIDPLFENKDILDHTLIQVKGTDLSGPQIALLEALYPTLTVADYTWNLLLNSKGDTTSGVIAFTLKELAGYLCDDTGKVVFVWNNNGEVTFELTDGTKYMGDPLDLQDCCCIND